MKNIIAFTAALALLTGQIYPSAVYSESVVSSPAQSSETLTLDITQSTEVTNGQFTISFDPEKLKLVEACAGDAFKGVMTAVDIRKDKVVIGFASAKVFELKGTLAELKFQQAPGTEDLSSLCSFSVDEFISLDKSGNEYTPDTGSIKLTHNSAVPEAEISLNGSVSEETGAPQAILNVSKANGVTNGLFTVNYSPDILKFEKGSICAGFEGTIAEINETTPGEIKIAFVNNEGLSAAGDFIKLDFSAVSTGTATLDVRADELLSVSEQGKITEFSADSDSCIITAAAPEKALISVSGTSLPVGGSSDITIAIPEKTGATNGIFTLKYDASKVKFENSMVCKALDGAMVEVNESEPGKITIAFIKNDGVLAGGDAVKLFFSGLTAGKTDVELYVTEFSKTPGFNKPMVIPTTAVNGTITVTPKKEISFDINGDGVINTSDLVLVKKCILIDPAITPEVMKKADINQNGVVNVLDLMRIVRYILG